MFSVTGLFKYVAAVLASLLFDLAQGIKKPDNAHYSNETLVKFIRRAQDEVEFWHKEIDAGRVPNMIISRGNKKIGNVPNFSVMPIITCLNCKECKYFCYDIKACLQYKNVMRARAINTALLLYAPAALHEQLEKYFSNTRRRNKSFRFNVGGEITPAYFNMIMSIVKRHADYTIWMYTKMYGIVNSYIRKRTSLTGRAARLAVIPSNYHIMYSLWDGTPVYNPYDFPLFAVRMKHGNKTPLEWNTLHKCPGNCQVCLKTGRGCPSSETSFVDEH